MELKSRLILIFVLSLIMTSAQAQYYDHDPDDPDHQAPIREGEKAVIPVPTI